MEGKINGVGMALRLYLEAQSWGEVVGKEVVGAWVERKINIIEDNWNYWEKVQRVEDDVTPKDLE